jgi:hypothetical protein
VSARLFDTKAQQFLSYGDKQELSMSFETVEKLKREYTDKWVVVDPNTPELKRFVGLSGRIKTINMSGRALVQFDGPVDISWYDIDLSYLKLIDAPLPKKTADKHGEAEKKPAPAAKPAAATGGKSPLELARAQGAAGSGAVKKSPLELAREQGAAKAAGAATTQSATGDKPLSKLEQARLQGAAKAKAAADAIAAPAATPEPVASAPAPAAQAAPVPASAPLVGEDGKPLSKLEMARRQGAAKPK